MIFERHPMKTYVPEDYEAFACLKGACRHTCCAGWEIDIDPDTWRLYEELTGPLAERLRACVTQEGDTVSFRLDEKGRCPMLNQEGLCELILQYGEGALCDICTDHPRYRNYFSDRLEMGLGLCCEAAARQAVFRTAPFRLKLLSDEGEEAELTKEEQAVLFLREQCVKAVQDGSVPYCTREQNVLNLLGGFVFPEPEEDLRFLKGLERLDPIRDEMLPALLKAPPCPRGERFEQALSQLASYFLFRHLPDAVLDGLTEARALFALWGVRLISRLTPEDDLKQLAETARMFSSEIEYSDENLAACFAYLDGHRNV